MSSNSRNNDYSRYFCMRQKVYLVNMSVERNIGIYESLSGVVVSSGGDTIELMISHGGKVAYCGEVGRTTCKLTSEVLGNGIQVLADLIGIADGNIFQFRMHGALEMFQRRIASRMESSIRIFHLCGNYHLPDFIKEWERVTYYMLNNRILPGLVLQETEVNIGTGGIGLTADAKKRPTPLSMFFIALDEGPPFCALAETVWEKPVDVGLRCGFRFIHILKADQERLNSCIGDMIRKKGGTHMDYKRNWVLVDKMSADGRKSE